MYLNMETKASFTLNSLCELYIVTSPPRSAAPRDHPAVHGNPGEPAVHRRARPPHPGRVPAVLRPAALRRTIPMKCVLVFTRCDEATH